MDVTNFMFYRYNTTAASSICYIPVDSSITSYEGIKTAFDTYNSKIPYINDSAESNWSTVSKSLVKEMNIVYTSNGISKAVFTFNEPLAFVYSASGDTDTIISCFINNVTKYAMSGPEYSSNWYNVSVLNELQTDPTRLKYSNTLEIYTSETRCVHDPVTQELIVPNNLYNVEFTYLCIYQGSIYQIFNNDNATVTIKYKNNNSYWNGKLRYGILNATQFAKSLECALMTRWLVLRGPFYHVAQYLLGYSVTVDQSNETMTITNLRQKPDIASNNLVYLQNDNSWFLRNCNITTDNADIATSFEINVNACLTTVENSDGLQTKSFLVLPNSNQTLADTMSFSFDNLFAEYDSSTCEVSFLDPNFIDSCFVFTTDSVYTIEMLGNDYISTIYNYYSPGNKRFIKRREPGENSKLVLYSDNTLEEFDTYQISTNAFQLNESCDYFDPVTTGSFLINPEGEQILTINNYTIKIRYENYIYSYLQFIKATARAITKFKYFYDGSEPLNANLMNISAFNSTQTSNSFTIYHSEPTPLANFTLELTFNTNLFKSKKSEMTNSYSTMFENAFEPVYPSVNFYTVYSNHGNFTVYDIPLTFSLDIIHYSFRTLTPTVSVTSLEGVEITQNVHPDLQISYATVHSDSAIFSRYYQNGNYTVSQNALNTNGTLIFYPYDNIICTRSFNLPFIPCLNESTQEFLENEITTNWTPVTEFDYIYNQDYLCLIDAQNCEIYTKTPERVYHIPHGFYDYKTLMLLLTETENIVTNVTRVDSSLQMVMNDPSINIEYYLSPRNCALFTNLYKIESGVLNVNEGNNLFYIDSSSDSLLINNELFTIPHGFYTGDQLQSKLIENSIFSYDTTEGVYYIASNNTVKDVNLTNCLFFSKLFSLNSNESIFQFKVKV